MSEIIPKQWYGHGQPIGTLQALAVTKRWGHLSSPVPSSNWKTINSSSPAQRKITHKSFILYQLTSACCQRSSAGQSPGKTVCSPVLYCLGSPAGMHWVGTCQVPTLSLELCFPQTGESRGSNCGVHTRLTTGNLRYHCLGCWATLPNALQLCHLARWGHFDQHVVTENFPGSPLLPFIP